jgi:hypothetical protein
VAVPGKRLNQRQHDCNNSPITNDSKTSKGEIKMSDQENRNPQHSDPQKAAPPEQKPIIQPNQPVQQKSVFRSHSPTRVPNVTQVVNNLQVKNQKASSSK